MQPSAIGVGFTDEERWCFRFADDEDLYVFDLLHYTREGYKLLASQLKPVVAQSYVAKTQQLQE